MADGFLGRWAKRKNDALQGKPLDEPAPSRLLAEPQVSLAKGAPGASAVALSPAAGAKPGAVAGASNPEPAGAEQAPLTLEDVQGLTKDSDFKPFMSKAVEPGVRNAAMKKLFTDPHFNVMDRMDIYIDDYSQPDPLPASMLRQMTSAKFLKLFDDEEEAKQQDQRGEGGEGDKTGRMTGQVTGQVAQAENLPSRDAGAINPPNSDNPQPPGTSTEADLHQDNHAHSDLRLQPDHAAESPRPGRSAA
jgi:hypothetical protein